MIHFAVILAFAPIFYKLSDSEFGCMYQKRPYPQNDFLLIFANLTQMFNDAVCYFGNNSNKKRF